MKVGRSRKRSLPDLAGLIIRFLRSRRLRDFAAKDVNLSLFLSLCFQLRIFLLAPPRGAAPAERAGGP